MAFAVKYRVEFTDRKGFDWKCDILEDAFVGSITDLRAWGGNPLKPRFRASSINLKHAPICPKDVELSITSDTDYTLMEFNYSTSKHYLLKVYNDVGDEFFEGFILKGLGGEAYTNPPYQVKLRATDGLAELKNTQYTHIGGNDVVRGSEVLMHITNDLVGITKSAFLDNSDLFPVAIVPGVNDTSLHSTYVNQQLFIREEMSAFEVLEDLMTTHNCRFYQREDAWVVDSLESHNLAPINITFKRRNATTYAYISDEVVPSRLVIGGNIGGASITFIEAPKEVQVNTDLVIFDNILENDGLDNWTTLSKWTELGGGTMAFSTDAQGYAAQDSFNTQTINGDPVLGIGWGITNSLYNLGATGLTHNITAIVDAGGGIFNLTFTNTFVGIAPGWLITDFLIIENRGNFEITTAPTVGAAGVSVLSVRVKDTDSTPKIGDRIIGKFNILYGLEQTLELPSTQTAQTVSKDSTKKLVLEVEYATQINGITGYGISQDIALHFIGIKVGPNNGDTFSGDKWGNTANNGVNTTITQFIQLPATEHEAFNTISIDIPLGWTTADNQNISVVLIGGYSASMVYKSINLKIEEAEEKTRTDANVADNNTTIVLDGSLFRAQGVGPNTAFMAVGGLLDSTGNEHILFDGIKDKNEVLSEFIQGQYSDNLQIWKGKIDNIIGGERILKFPANFDRTFQIQEVTNNLNDFTSNITAVEFDTQGLIPPIYTIVADPISLTFADQTQFEESTLIINIENTGNVGMTIHGEPSAYFECSADTFIGTSPSPDNHDFIITAPTGGTPSTTFNETITFQDTAGKSNIIIVPVEIEILSALATFTVTDGDANQTVEIAERYDYESPAAGTSVEQINNLHSALISVDVQFFGPNVIASPDPVNNIPIAGSSNTTFQSTYTKITNPIGTTINVEWLDIFTSPAYKLTGWSANYKIKALGRMTTYSPDSIIVLANRIKVGAGGFVNLPAGTIDFHFGDVITWEVTVDGSPPNVFGETLQMEVFNRGGVRFKNDTVSVGFGTTTTTIVFTARSTSTFNYFEGSIDLKLFEI